MAWQLTITAASPVLFLAFCLYPIRTLAFVVWAATVWSVVEVALAR